MTTICLTRNQATAALLAQWRSERLAGDSALGDLHTAQRIAAAFESFGLVKFAPEPSPDIRLPAREIVLRKPNGDIVTSEAVLAEALRAAGYRVYKAA